MLMINGMAVLVVSVAVFCALFLLLAACESLWVEFSRREPAI